MYKYIISSVSHGNLFFYLNSSKYVEQFKLFISNIKFNLILFLVSLMNNNNNNDKLKWLVQPGWLYLKNWSQL